VAHNTAATYVVKEHRKRAQQWVSLDDVEAPGASDEFQDRTEQRLNVERLMELVRNLRPPDRQLMLLYLEDLDAQSIGDITGISAGHVRVQLHRIRKILAERFHGGSRHE
jgi:RNA polymerase sigma-70 factor (ECF subfamily)